MEVRIDFNLNSREDFSAFANLFTVLAGHSGAQEQTFQAENVVRAEAPAPQPVVSAPLKQVEKQPDPAPDSPADDGGEVVDKSLVAKELRAFIAKKGETGPKEALAVLKQFGAQKFDELKQENYAKFLSALSKVD